MQHLLLSFRCAKIRFLYEQVLSATGYRVAYCVYAFYVFCYVTIMHCSLPNSFGMDACTTWVQDISCFYLPLLLCNPNQCGVHIFLLK